MFGWITKFKSYFVKSQQEYYSNLLTSMSPCPICGHKAALIHWCGENKPEFWTVECGDFDDSNYFCPVPKRCNFYTTCNPHYEVKEHYTIEGAIMYWNNVVVPIGIAAKIAFDRIQKYDRTHMDGNRKD